MNVDTFSSNPGLKWYFISAVPFVCHLPIPDLPPPINSPQMVAVLVLWYLLKHWFAKSRAMPLQRGAYENMFTDLQSNYPHLWTRQGPRDDIIPADRASRLKWRLVTRWTTGDALPKATGSPGEDDPIGTWNMIKRKLVQRWTAEIKLEPVAKDPETGENGIPAFKNAAGRISEEIDLAPVTEGSSHGRNSQEMVDEKLAGNEEVVTQAGDSERLGFSHVDWARVASMKARKEQARVEELQRKDREGEEKKHG